jgi:hypothetical protein
MQDGVGVRFGRFVSGLRKKREVLLHLSREKKLQIKRESIIHMSAPSFPSLGL